MLKEKRIRTVHLERGTSPSHSWELLLNPHGPHGKTELLSFLDVNSLTGDSLHLMLLYILCGAHYTILLAGLYITKLHRRKNDLQSRLLLWTLLFLIYVTLLVTLPWTLKNTVVYTAVETSWVYVACYDACRSADNPLAIPAVIELEVQHRALDSYCVIILFMFIESRASLVVSWQGRPGPCQSLKCKSPVLPGELAAHQIVSSVMDAMLKRGDRTLGYKKASRCNVLKQRICTDQHRTTKKSREFTQRFTVETKRTAAAH